MLTAELSSGTRLAFTLTRQCAVSLAGGELVRTTTRRELISVAART